MTKNERWIDSLKGVAIIGVLCSHIDSNGLNGIIQKVFYGGARGVQIFFVISAFLAFQSLKSHYKQAENTIFLWYKKKAKRLLPLYYLFLIYLLLMQMKVGIDKSFLANWMAHVLLVNVFSPQYINSLLGLEWYIADLILFFLIAPFLYKVINSAEKAILSWGISAIGIAVLNNVILSLIDLSNYNLVSYISNFSFATQLPAILAGIVLFYCYDTLKDLKIRNKDSICVLLMVLSVDLFASLIMGSRIIGFSSVSLYSLGVLGIIVAINNRKFSIIDNRMFAFLGKHSYGIYLFQFMFLENINGISISVNQYILYGLKLLMVLGLSLISALVWEKVENLFKGINFTIHRSKEL